ncbi:nucleoside hydrolase [Wenyingzhuangia sp. 2_MG-2023]|uniref:nucleoside hydrolase n=1 Tax=Wenyingzhuangia sp. 2_MG-2023 TaxID=3062639 RepID=UPI0026E1CEB4|nr:nucleoside hydrolase [Wenyingzhuangia sp. 2_MG-2023]MDO6738160.1 nucleoside hydrolase [Wenyingzhuangia sp. 2_MG-2023]
MVFIFVFAFLGNDDVIAQEKIKLIIDADTANEVDDLFAIVRALNEPKFDLLGITSAQFHTSPLASKESVKESQKINEEIVKLADRTDVPTPLGSNIPLKSASKASPSAASKFIIEQVLKLKKNEKLNVVVLGSSTNVASAILEAPEIIPKLKVHYIGFWHTVATNQYNKKEFNSNNDSIAVEVLLNTRNLDFQVMSATTCQYLVFNKITVDQKLKGKGPLANYLVNRWETYNRWWTQKDKEKKQWIMWDVAIIEALVHPEWTTKQEFYTPKENTQRKIKIHTAINVEKMENNFWLSLKDIQ